MPCPLQVDFSPFDLESGVRVTCDVGYLCANFSLPRLLCSQLRPMYVKDVRRQTDVRCTLNCLMPPTLQPWARAVCTLPAVPSTLRGMVNEYQLSG